MEESSEEAARHHFTFNSLYLPNITRHFYSERSHSQRGGTETVLIYSCESFSAWIKHPPWLQRTKKMQYLLHWHNSATRLINLLLEYLLFHLTAVLINGNWGLLYTLKQRNCELHCNQRKKTIKTNKHLNKTFLSDNTITKTYNSEIFKVPQYAYELCRNANQSILYLFCSPHFLVNQFWKPTLCDVTKGYLSQWRHLELGVFQRLFFFLIIIIINAASLDVQSERE